MPGLLMARMTHGTGKGATAAIGLLGIVLTTAAGATLAASASGPAAHDGRATHDGSARQRCPRAAAMALDVDGAALCIFTDDGMTGETRARVQAWIQRSARIVADYYGRFPAAQVTLQIHSVAGGGVRGGRTTDDGGLVIQVSVGAGVTAQELSADWVLVHEMVHLALPEMGRRHNWLAEGLATYVEGIARAQAGNRDIRDVWAEQRHSMPRGLPQPGEGGMDQTATWGRTYWGGALFCLQAEVAIREQTGNRAGLQLALRAILRETGGYATERAIGDVLRIGDAATGTRVLQDLYEKSAMQPQTPDLAELWSRLGVPDDPLTEAFDDHAPLAAVRIAITRPMRP
jgi:hypothetical protein